ncbi:MAG TPA: flavin reductase family protein [Trueperaceae bacterium]|nr:flavin reductase family protein [Trueperaceae bacterium]
MSLPGVRTSTTDQGAATLSEGERGFDDLDFRRTMGRFPTGVTVVTMLGPGERPYGVTVNAFMSVSLEPPLVAVSLGQAARAHPTLAASERFAVSVLAEDQRALSDRFAGRRAPTGDDPFVPFHGFPVIEGAVAHVLCRMHSSFEAGDHTIFVGEVEALRTSPGAPLVFHSGRYGALASEPDNRS